ncbi:MAG: hypothetical protein H7144_11195 [Burkholderiales bacterium]|nr:hypothetical protein [Phycisphaerae bacterium]
MTTLPIHPRSATIGGLRPLVWGTGLLLSAVAMAAMLVVYSLVFFSFGLVLASVVVSFLCAIPAAGLVEQRRDCFLMATVIGVATAAPVLLAATEQFLSAIQVLFLCIATVVLTIGCCRTLNILMDRSFAASIVLIAGVLWITLPVWASPWLDRPAMSFVVDWVLPIQPVIALNGAYPSLGAWSHQAVSYKWLTNLGTDVPYKLPENAWPAILAHVAAAGAVLAIWRGRSNAKTQA